MELAWAYCTFTRSTGCTKHEAVIAAVPPHTKGSRVLAIEGPTSDEEGEEGMVVRDDWNDVSLNPVYLLFLRPRAAFNTCMKQML
jgi:hypothetical protein